MPRTSNTQPPTGADTMRTIDGNVTVKTAIIIVTCRSGATSPMKSTSATAKKLYATPSITCEKRITGIVGAMTTLSAHTA